MRQADKLSFRAFALLLLFAMFFPTFYNQIGSSGAILLNGGILIGLGAYFLFIRKLKIVFISIDQKKLFITISFLFLFFLFHIVFSIINGYVFGGIDVIQRDFYELHRPVFYLLTFSMGFVVFSSGRNIPALEKLLTFTFLVFVLLGVNNMFSTYDSITELYVKSANLSTRRVSAPFVEPYDYAFMMSFFVFYYFFKMIFTMRFYVVLFLVALYMFLAAQSSSVAIGLSIGFLLFLPIVLLIFFAGRLKKLLFTKRLVIFVFTFLFVIIGVIFSLPYLEKNYVYLTGKFVLLLDGYGIGTSAQTRLDQFLFALEKSNANFLLFIFGNGPAKSEMEFVESIYTYQFYRYGVIGVLGYFLVIKVLVVYFSWKVMRRIGWQHENYPLFAAILIWFLTIPFMSIGNNFTEQVRQSFFFYSILGLIVATYSQYTKFSMQKILN